MAYNYFPMGYQPYVPTPQMQAQNQMMTPPTIHAEIVQVGSEQEAANYPVGMGASQMMIAKDDSAIYVKTATQNGATLEVFVKRPQKPPAPAFDPSEYVTKEELDRRLEALKRGVENESV